MCSIWNRVERNAEDYAGHVTPEAGPLLDAFATAMATVEWNKEAIAAAIKQLLKEQGAKMPQLAMPVRVLTVGTATRRRSMRCWNPGARKISHV